MAGVTTKPNPMPSLEMGMHTEALAGRSQQRFFDISEESIGLAIPMRPMSTSTSGRRSTARPVSRATSISRSVP